MSKGNKIKIVEVYAGTGRSLEPFVRRWRRAEVALLVDANPLAQRVYLRNKPQAPYKLADLSACEPADVLQWAGGTIDVLLGCPPCQGFSENGARATNDPRNKHVEHFAAIALAARPRAIVMENVPLAAASDHFKVMVAALERAGYVWTAAIANAVQYGSCQSRQRLLFVAIDANRGDVPTLVAPSHGAKGSVFSYSARRMRTVKAHPIEMMGVTPATQRLARLLPQDCSSTLGPAAARTLEAALSGLPEVGSREAEGIDHSAWMHSPALLARMRRIPEGGRWSGGDDHYSHTYGRLHRKGFARTLTTFFPYAGGGRFWHPSENRSLTVREAARIQGFPDTFRFGERSRRVAALVGNALDDALANACYETVRKAIG